MNINEYYSNLKGNFRQVYKNFDGIWKKVKKRAAISGIGGEFSDEDEF